MLRVSCLQLVDFDTVEESNIASQGYYEADLGRGKVEATADICRQINPSLEVFPIADRFRRKMNTGDVIFTCVDSIDIRRLIWEAVRDRSGFFCDGRMSAEVLRVLTVSGSSSREYYPNTLFTAAEAHQGSCTAKTTIYCANVAAGLMVAQFAKWLRGLPVEPDIALNILSAELTANSP